MADDREGPRRRQNLHRVLIVAGALLIVVVGLLFFRQSRSGDEAPVLIPDPAENVGSSGALGSATGIEGRVHDPASLQKEFVIGQRSIEDYRQLADDARDLEAELTLSRDTKWMKTLIELNFSEEENQATFDCLSTHLRNSACEVKLEYVIEPSNGFGEIAYVRGGAVATEDEQPEACDRYASCLAEHALGRKVHIPTGATEAFGFLDERQDNLLSVGDVQKLKRLVAGYRMLARKIRNNPPSDDPTWPYRAAQYEADAELFAKILEWKKANNQRDGGA